MESANDMWISESQDDFIAQVNVNAIGDLGLRAVQVLIQIFLTNFLVIIIYRLEQIVRSVSDLL